MICDALRHADPTLDLSGATSTPARFQQLNDHILSTIECSTKSELRPSQDILKRIQTRKLYEFIDEIIVLPGHVMASVLPNVVTPEAIVKHVGGGFHAVDDVIIIQDTKMNYTNGESNPLEHVCFYSSLSPQLKFHFNSEHPTSLLVPAQVRRRGSSI